MINRHKENFSIISNDIANNKALSLKAKGLYLYLCSKPDNWEFCYRGIMAQIKEGEKAIRSAIKELVKERYLLRVPKRDNGSFAGWDWIINPTESDSAIAKDPTLIERKNSHSRNSPFPEVAVSGSSQKGYLLSNTILSNTILSNIKDNTKEINKEKIELPKELQTEAFKTAWSDWVNHRKEIKKKLTPTTISRHLNFLKTLGEEFAIKSIDRSISNSWQGLFVPEDCEKDIPTFKEIHDYLEDIFKTEDYTCWGITSSQREFSSKIIELKYKTDGMKKIRSWKADIKKWGMMRQKKINEAK